MKALAALEFLICSWSLLAAQENLVRLSALKRAIAGLDRLGVYSASVVYMGGFLVRLTWMNEALLVLTVRVRHSLAAIDMTLLTLGVLVTVRVAVTERVKGPAMMLLVMWCLLMPWCLVYGEWLQQFWLCI